MRRSLLLLPAACLLVLFAACGEDLLDGQVEASPLFFADQTFDCDDSTPAPSCPPFTCAVDDTGAVYDCDQGCNFENDSTAFEFRGTSGLDLCVPPVCTVSGEGVPPECEPGCAEDDTTIYVFEYTCP